MCDSILVQEKDRHMYKGTIEQLRETGMNWRSIAVCFTNLVCTEVKISMSVKGGILLGKASNMVASTWTLFMSLQNGQAESAWPFSMSNTLVPCQKLGVLRP